MWGNLTQSCDRTQNKVILEPKELNSFMTTAGIEVKIVTFASNDVVRISWKHAAEEHVPGLRHANEVIETYVTAGAWINLYRYLGRLGENANYCDTDSIIYSQPRDDHRPIETGDMLRDMTSELRPKITYLYL